MLKLFSSLILSFFIFFQSTLIAEEDPNVQQEAAIEEPSETEEISEAQKEADAAEAAELREAGIGEETLPEE